MSMQSLQQGRKRTSSPRSRASSSCFLKVFSSAHLAQMSSSVFGKSSAGGRDAMVAFVLLLMKGGFKKRGWMSCTECLLKTTCTRHYHF